MKLVNYNPGIISENIHALRASTQQNNTKKNHVVSAIKIIMCLILIAIASLGVMHSLAHVHNNLLSIGTIIVIVTITSVLLFSVALTENTDAGWIKRKTFEMLYYDVDQKGKITSVQQGEKKNTIIVSYLDNRDYVQKTEIPLTNIVETPAVEEDTLDIAHGTLFLHYKEGAQITYAT